MPMHMYQGDEHLTDDHPRELKTIDTMTIADIGGEDHSVWIKRNPKFGYDLYIENEDCSIVLDDKGIHPYSIKSMAHFCRQFLHQYEKE